MKAREREALKIARVNRAAAVGRLMAGQLKSIGWQGFLADTEADALSALPRRKLRGGVVDVRERLEGSIEQFCRDNFERMTLERLADLYTVVKETIPTGLRMPVSQFEARFGRIKNKALLDTPPYATVSITLWGLQFEYPEHHFMEDVVVALKTASAAHETAKAIGLTKRAVERRDHLKEALRCEKANCDDHADATRTAAPPHERHKGSAILMSLRVDIGQGANQSRDRTDSSGIWSAASTRESCRAPTTLGFRNASLGRMDRLADPEGAGSPLTRRHRDADRRSVHPCVAGRESCEDAAMRTRARWLVGLFLVVFLAPAFAQAPGWVLYTHPDKLMSVRFPGKPSETAQEAPTEFGMLRFKLATFSNEDRGYVAGAFIYPDATELNIPKALDGARDQMLANIKGKLVSEKAIKLDGFQGREVRFEAAGPNSSHLRGVARMFASAKPPGAYMASAMQVTGKPDPDAQKFLDSLHLGKKVETKP